MSTRMRDFLFFQSSLSRYVLFRILYRMQFLMLGFYQDAKTIAFLRSIYAETRLIQKPFEAFLLYELARAQSSIDGAMAEVGMYAGATAKIICSVKGNRAFYGFDTFAGLPAPQEIDMQYAGNSSIKENNYSAAKDQVSQYLHAYPDVHLTQGLFPQSADGMTFPPFSFVHLDVDHYTGTKESLIWFWKRMMEKGVIVIHDSHFPGVRKAIEEFSDGVTPRPRCFHNASQAILLT